MEDLKAYIESGILELYVLGELTNEEKHEVEGLAAQYPEIRTELEKIENALIKYSEANAVEPPANMRSSILSALNPVTNNEVNVVPISGLTRVTTFYKVAFAASLALLILSVVALITLNGRLQRSYERIAVLESSNVKYSNEVNYQNRQLEATQKALDVYQNPSDYKLVTLTGTPKAPESTMRVAFNPSTQEVMIDLSSMAMPSNDEDHQYQLWALVDGKPVDLGVFDSSAANLQGMKTMKPVEYAQAFAVTLEPRGGSAAPTLEEMVVMGNL